MEASPIWFTSPNGPLSSRVSIASPKETRSYGGESHLEEERSAEINIRGGSVRSSAIQTFAAPDIHAHNSFENPDAVNPQDTVVTLRDKPIWTFKPAPVTKLEFESG